MTDFWFWLVFAVIVPGIVLLFAAFLLRRDYVQRRRMAALQDDYQRRCYLSQPYMRDAIDEEEEAIERARIILS